MYSAPLARTLAPIIGGAEETRVRLSGRYLDGGDRACLKRGAVGEDHVIATDFSPGDPTL